MDGFGSALSGGVEPGCVYKTANKRSIATSGLTVFPKRLGKDKDC